MTPRSSHSHRASQITAAKRRQAARHRAVEIPFDTIRNFTSAIAAARAPEFPFGSSPDVTYVDQDGRAA
ncbi:hypothetical protein ACVI1L_005664 [Bradyrhizobium sp. USDA 4516]